MATANKNPARLGRILSTHDTLSRKQIPYGIFRSILFQSGLKESDFRDMNQ